MVGCKAFACSALLHVNVFCCRSRTGCGYLYHFTTNTIVTKALISLWDIKQIQCTSKAEGTDVRQSNTTAEVKPTHNVNSLHTA